MHAAALPFLVNVRQLSEDIYNGANSQSFGVRLTVQESFREMELRVLTDCVCCFTAMWTLDSAMQA